MRLLPCHPPQANNGAAPLFDYDLINSFLLPLALPHGLLIVQITKAI